MLKLETHDRGRCFVSFPDEYRVRSGHQRIGAVGC